MAGKRNQSAPLLLAMLGVCVWMPAGNARPNILFILTDDQAPHTLSVYGNKICQTPHLDKLAASGMVLDQAYHMGSMSGAVCSPSRTMIMSGRTLWHLPPRGKKYLKNEEKKITNMPKAGITSGTYKAKETYLRYWQEFIDEGLGFINCNGTGWYIHTITKF